MVIMMVMMIINNLIVNYKPEWGCGKHTFIADNSNILIMRTIS